VPAGKLSEKMLKIKYFFASLKSLKTGVGSVIGSGSISQRYGSAMSRILNTGIKCDINFCANPETFVNFVLLTAHKAGLPGARLFEERDAGASLLPPKLVPPGGAPWKFLQSEYLTRRYLSAVSTFNFEV
jgi:hypothetical protein